MNDYYRPSAEQVDTIYRCDSCGKEVRVVSIYSAPKMCDCGGNLQEAGVSYPADPADWDEERDEYGEWRRRY